MIHEKLALRAVSKLFTMTESGSSITALRDVSLSVADGEFLVVVGRSGCGKTTLLRLIAGLTRPSEGDIQLDAREVTGPGPDRGMVFQEHWLFPWLVVEDNVGFALHGKGMSKDRRARIVRELLKLVGLERFAQSYPKELSGGMRQRAGIARALAADPEILLMDEPFGSVDIQTRATLQAELLSIWDRTGKTIVFVTHSVEEAVFLADRIVILHSNPGRVAAEIPVHLPRPRVRTSPEFNTLESKVLELLDEGAE